MTELGQLESTIHHYLVRGLIDDGFAPDIGKLQESLAVDASSVKEALKRLEASHRIVCHPGRAAPWGIHPHGRDAPVPVRRVFFCSFRAAAGSRSPALISPIHL